MTALGFRAVISRKGTHADKANLTKVLEDSFYTREVKRRKKDVDLGLSKLLREIDRAASDSRRGVPRKLAAIRMEGIEIDTAFDPQVLESYFETLTKQTEESPPRTVEKLAIPETILRKSLPHLTADGYTGASHRVWKILAARYGVKVGEEQSSAATDSSTASSAEASVATAAVEAKDTEPPPVAEATPTPDQT